MAKSLNYSVLMPLAPWEQPHILLEALESLEGQTLPPSQVVVSCDGPLPLPLLRCLEGSGLPIEFTMGPGSEGVGPVLARGLLQCREELVIRVDADDISVPQRAARQVSWMYRNPCVLVMSTPINEFTHRIDLPHFQRWVPEEPGAIHRIAFMRNPINHPSVILRRSAILAVGNYHSVPGFEDYELWLRLIRAHGSGVLANLSESLVFARVGPEHLSRRHGVSYAISEVCFLFHCACHGLLPFVSIIRSLLFRVPLRLLPSKILAKAMKVTTRRPLIGH